MAILSRFIMVFWLFAATLQTSFCEEESSKYEDVYKNRIHANREPINNNIKHIKRLPSGCGRIKAITFDDGPSPTYTPILLDILKKNNVKATFFVLGSNVAKYPHLIKRIVNEGHEVGVHGYAHNSFLDMTLSDVREEINKTIKLIQKAADGYTPAVIRPPYGSINAKIASMINNEFGMKVILWGVDPADWMPKTTAEIIAGEVENSKPSSITLMHDSGGNRLKTINAMEAVLPIVIKQFRLVTISEGLACKQKKTIESSNPDMLSYTDEGDDLILPIV